MVRRLLTVLIFIFPFVAWGQNTLPPIGAWREHLPYHSAQDVAASPNKIFCATPFSLFSIDKATNEIERFSKIAGLSETGISTINYHATAQKLVVAYANSNIDIISANDIKNVPGLKRENIAGDKSIYHIYPSPTYCYLSTGLGVLLLDVDKYEIKDSWFIGKDGSNAKVNMFTQDNSYYYAATEEGLKKALRNSINPADFRSWQNISGTGGLPPTSCKGVVNLQNNIIALQNDSLFIQGGSEWKLFFTNGWPISSIHTADNVLSICQRLPSGESKVVFLNAAGAVVYTLFQPGVVSFPQKAIATDNGYWLADLYGGISHWAGSSFEQYKLNSPEDIATGEMKVHNNVLYAAAGAVNRSWNYQYNGNGVYQYKEGTWTNYNRFHFPQLDSLLDFVTIAADPRNASIWAGSFGGGLLHVKGDKNFDIYKQGTPIGPTIGDPGSYRVSGLAFDAANNLWIANFGAALYLHVLKSDGSWQSFNAPFSLFENSVSQILIDDADQKWIVAPKGDGLLLFNHGASIETSTDDQWKLYRTGSGNGNLPSNTVLSIAKDKSGMIWVGTIDGAAVIPCPQEAFASGCEAVLPVSKEGSFAGYLFKGEEVRSIAVNGANQKWMATGNGVWLLSPDGDKVLAHYTESNSPLLSNDVKQIAVNGTTGEVFFGTAKGICSFRGTATEGTGNKESLLVFPNPVPPGYTGTIAIRGLPENAFVKITEPNGRLVFQTRAQGGQAIWNGTDYKGKRIATGVYLVLVSSENRQEKRAGKIVFIR